MPTTRSGKRARSSSERPTLSLPKTSASPGAYGPVEVALRAMRAEEVELGRRATPSTRRGGSARSRRAFARRRGASSRPPPAARCARRCETRARPTRCSGDAVAAQRRATLPVFGGISGSTRTTWSGTAERLGPEARRVGRGGLRAIFGHQLDARRRQTVASRVEAATLLGALLPRNPKVASPPCVVSSGSPVAAGDWPRPAMAGNMDITPERLGELLDDRPCTPNNVGVGQPDERARDGDRADRLSLGENDGPRRLRAEPRDELHPRERRRDAPEASSTGTTGRKARSTRTPHAFSVAEHEPGLAARRLQPQGPQGPRLRVRDRRRSRVPREHVALGRRRRPALGAPRGLSHGRARILPGHRHRRRRAHARRIAEVFPDDGRDRRADLEAHRDRRQRGAHAVRRRAARASSSPTRRSWT